MGKGEADTGGVTRSWHLQWHGEVVGQPGGEAVRWPLGEAATRVGHGGAVATEGGQRVGRRPAKRGGAGRPRGRGEPGAHMERRPHGEDLAERWQPQESKGEAGGRRAERSRAYVQVAH